MTKPDSHSANRLAVDIGGTFTDVVLEWHGALSSTKVLTDHAEPARGVLSGVQQVLGGANARLDQIDLILHGTTLATNALIERRGAPTALLTTEGHRDVLAMAYENRFEQYDLRLERPIPLVPRHLRLPIRERLDVTGGVRVPLDAASADAAIEQCRQAGVEAIAIGLLHAYANPAHEQALAARVRAALPDVSVTLASEVCPEIREYERFSTAVANAYVQPLMSRYLTALERALSAAGFNGSLLLMTSGGGLTQVATAAAFPIRLVESGPAGGAILAASHARRLELDQVLAFDMGGTTAKLALIDGGVPQLSRAFEVDRQYRFRKGSGLPVRIPVIEMVEIGAGGGSIAGRDGVGRLQVGPASAGSDPGPACYGRGGIMPTVTDADLQLGRLAADAFAGGELALDSGAAAAALHALGDAEQQAHAVTEVVDENMAAAARAHANEWGKDLAGRTLIAFGGAAPLHAARVAARLGVRRILIPAGAGVGSALGFLAAPVAYEVVRSRYTLLSAYAPEQLDTLSAEMRAEAEAVVRPAVGPVADLICQRFAFMRYLGQGYEIAVALPASGPVSAALLRERFEQSYVALYNRSIPGLDIEILSYTLSLKDRDVAALPAAPQPVQSLDAVVPAPDWSLYDAATEQRVRAVRWARERLPEQFEGPALITEAQTTTYLPAGYRGQVNRWGDLELIRDD